MSTLAWSDDLALGIEQMDQTHQEFVALRAAVEAATDEQLLQRWKDLIDHTKIHFDNEDKWMRDTNFAASNCHTTHHKAVLDVMRPRLVVGPGEGPGVDAPEGDASGHVAAAWKACTSGGSTGAPKVIVDGRNCLDIARWQSADWRVHCLGRLVR